MTILVCGEALYDLFQTDEPEPGRLTLDARVGGSPFNVAIGLARMETPAALLTGMSTDLLGDRLAAQLEREGVGTGYLVRTGRRTTLSVVGVDADGGPSYAFYGVGSADCSLTEGDLPDIGADVAALHFGSYSIAVTPVADALSALAQGCRDRFISLDPNVRPTIEPDMQIWRTRIDALRSIADLIKVSAEDLGMLYPDERPEAIIRRWAEDGAGMVVLTDGGASVYAVRGSDEIRVTPPATEIVDTVGAGDTFQAVLLSEIWRSGAMSVREADRVTLEGWLSLAARAAAVTCTRRGADLPRRGDL
ncbi:MAG: carbohydrate kinase [Pseudomonadota bacterium]